LQASIAASFKTEREERNNTRTVEEVNQVLLERAMEISQDRAPRAKHARLFMEAERHCYSAMPVRRLPARTTTAGMRRC
jgi:hypothetical protein